jgi:hypothetical protein
LRKRKSGSSTSRDTVFGITTIPDEALITINSLEILGIIYLAVAVSKLRERIARSEGKNEERERPKPPT